MAARRGFWLAVLLIIAGGVVPWTLLAWGILGNVGTALPASLPLRSMPLTQQAAQAIAGLIIKPTYMLLSGLIILALVGQPAGDVRAVQWGQVAFLSGEIFCAINFYVFQHASVLSEYLHSYGMAVAFGLTAFGLFEAFDRRILRLSDSPGACAALKVCGRCARHETAGCKARSVALVALPALAVLSVIPLFSSLQPEAYGVTILGFPYSYARLDLYEFYERRLLPVAALISMAVAFILILRRSPQPLPRSAKIFAALGLGALGFSFFRTTLNALFAGSLVWFEFWEETTEFLFISFAAYVLWQVRGSILNPTPMLEALGIEARPGKGEQAA